MAQTIILSQGQFMKTTITLMALTLFSSEVFAANHCAKYTNYPRYMKAIEAVAKYQDYSVEEFCSLPRVWDVEAQPSRIVKRDGEVIPHVTVQQHFEYDSCLFMVNETDYTISQHRCYSGM